MKVVIDTNDDIKELLNSEDITERLLAIDNLIKAFKDGTVLPKGHGDLIDRDTIQINAEKFHCLGDLQTAQWEVYIAETVIPADK